MATPPFQRRRLPSQSDSGTVTVITAVSSNHPKLRAPVASKDKNAPWTLNVEVPVAPEYFPVPPVTIPVSVRMNGKEGVGNVDKSVHDVPEVDLRNKRSPVAVKRKTATSATSVNSVPAPAPPPGTVQVFPSGANSSTAWLVNLPALLIPSPLM